MLAYGEPIRDNGYVRLQGDPHRQVDAPAQRIGLELTSLPLLGEVRLAFNCCFIGSRLQIRTGCNSFATATANTRASYLAVIASPLLRFLRYARGWDIAVGLSSHLIHSSRALWHR